MPPKKLTKTKKPIAPKEEPASAPVRYFEARGGRKTAVARVRLYTKQKGFLVNEKDYKEYFKDPILQKEALQPLEAMNVLDKLGATVKVNGGGLAGQAEAVRHGLSRALVLSEAELRPKLKSLGFLKRDPRAKERRKFGLKKARKAPKWSKR